MNGFMTYVESENDGADRDDEDYQRHQDWKYGLGEKQPDRISVCCHAFPTTPISRYKDPQTGRDVWTGYCSRCKEGSEFVTEDEYDRLQ